MPLWCSWSARQFEALKGRVRFLSVAPHNTRVEIISLPRRRMLGLCPVAARCLLTSAVRYAIMAWPETVDRKDLRIDFYRGSGPGGQHKNKTDSACRITHLPTGISAKCEDERKQSQNKKRAFQRLAEKLVPIMKASLQPTKESPVVDTIRTYKEKGMVIDHRSGKKAPYKEVLSGKALDKLIAPVAQRTEQLPSKQRS